MNRETLHTRLAFEADRLACRLDELAFVMSVNPDSPSVGRLEVLHEHVAERLERVEDILADLSRTSRVA